MAEQRRWPSDLVGNGCRGVGHHGTRALCGVRDHNRDRQGPFFCVGVRSRHSELSVATGNGSGRSGPVTPHDRGAVFSWSCPEIRISEGGDRYGYQRAFGCVQALPQERDRRIGRRRDGPVAAVVAAR